MNSPFLIGCLKPIIILPDVDMDDFELSLILRHEGFHLKNRDIPFKFALELLKSLNWFNPILGIVQKTYNQASEFVVDDMVTEELSIAQRKIYGQLLLKFSEHNIKKRPHAFLYLSEEAKHLADRLEAIMKMDKNKKINKFIITFAVVVVVTTVGVGAYITSDACVSTAEAQFRISEPAPIDSVQDTARKVGCLIFDDGKVQIFDGPEDESIPDASFDIGEGEDASIPAVSFDIEDGENVSKGEVKDVSKEGDKARQDVLETGEYRAKAKAGDPIYSLVSGTVVSAKYEQGYGYCVTVEAEEGSLWKYAHCSKLLVDSGAKVFEGEVLALAGKTGYAEQDSIFILRIKKEK